MIQESKRYISYICPHCHQSVIVARDVFSLAAAPAQIKCPCGRSELRVDLMGIDVSMKVPCLFCGREHAVRCSSDAFLRQKALAFSCTASGLDCCYVGEEGAVYAATARLEQAVDKLDQHRNQEQEGTFLDEIVMQEVLSELKDIAQRGGISCACGSKQWGLKVNYSSIDLQCGQCGAEMRIPAATADDIDDICCKHTILIRGRKG